MQEALKNPHFKKIWEKVIMNNNPREDTLIDALLSEASNDDCLFIQNGYIGIPQVFSNDCGYAYAFNFCSDYNYENNRKISFYDDEERKRYYVNTGVLLEEYTEEILNKERVLQHILGRPITLEDIINLFTKQEINKGAGDVEIRIFTSSELANLYNISITGYVETGEEPQCHYVGDFLYSITTPLHEQTPETWEKIANLID